MTVETQEKLEQALAKYGIKGEWMDEDINESVDKNLTYTISWIEK